MGDTNESKNDSTFLTGLSRKRSYQGIRDSISGSLKKIGNKKAKLEGSYDGKLSSDRTFKYGNYNRYYGYRNENEEDLRMTVLKKEWFENKSVLDIGSNVGHVSLWIGRNFHPEKIKGVDIDCELVKAARKNIVHYIDENYVSSLERSFNNDDNFDDDLVDEKIVGKENESDSVKKHSENDSGNLNPAEEESRAEKKMLLKDSLLHNGEGSKGLSVLCSIEEKSESSEKSEVAESEDCKDTCDKTIEEVEHSKGQTENDEINSFEAVNEESESKVAKEITLDCKNTISKGKSDVNKNNSNDKEMGNILMERLDKNQRIKKENIFPYNVTFILENYVPAGKQILQYIKEEYDIILCLSVTKWVQLNFGDFGLKLMFKKIFKQLHPGGKLILEPQPYKSYKRRKNLTPEIRRNYDSMKLMPDQFIEFLLSDEVGFSKSEQIDITPHQKQGFHRPLYLLSKE